MEMRLAVDRHLRRLGKWLRVLGYDTLCQGTQPREPFLAQVVSQARQCLTREKGLASLLPHGTVQLIRSDGWDRQLGEAQDVLSLTPDPLRWFTRCLHCNVLLEEAGRDLVQGHVPDHVWQRQERFRHCPCCGRFYWPGTHRQRMEEALRRRSPGGRR